MNRRIRRVSRWVDDLLHERSPRGFRRADEDASLLAAAIELQNASPSAGLPDPQFVESLRHRIAREHLGRGPHGAAAVPARAACEWRACRSHRRRGARRRRATYEPVDTAARAAAGRGPRGLRLRCSRIFPRVRHAPSTRDRSVGSSSIAGKIAALSGVCTHLGCLLQLNASARRLDCPCHTAAFGFDGNVLFKHMPDALPPLPLMETRIRNGQIEVLTV